MGWLHQFSWFFGHFITPLVVADDAAYDDHEQG